jgi:glutaredoxin
MKQQCPMSFIYLTWGIIVFGFIALALVGDYVSAVSLVAFGLLALWLYVRYFPAISQYIGYGRVDDRAARGMQQTPAHVVLYTAFGCPFCPLVKNRLLNLKTKMGFDLEEVDVTLKPNLLRAKGISAVPVVEVAGRKWIGNATSEQLASLIREGSHGGS